MATALITGASSGIGKELAKIHASKGGDLILVARNEESLNDLKKELESTYNVKVINIIKDLSVLGATKEIYEQIKALEIEVEYLFNNAGFGLLGKFHELSWERQQQMINLNMTAVTELTYLFLPDMIKRNKGKILNTSSSASLVPGPLQAVYYASKAYVTFLGNALAEELRGTNITVTNLLPGATETKFGSTSGMDKTKGFAKTVNPTTVAKDGYEAMLRGDLDILSGLTCMQRFMLKMIPFTPKRMLLKNVRKFQEEK